MGVYNEVCKCKECRGIYKKGIPYIYTKCGAKIGTHTPFILQALGGDEVTMTDKCEKIVTKKTLFG